MNWKRLSSSFLASFALCRLTSCTLHLMLEFVQARMGFSSSCLSPWEILPALWLDSHFHADGVRSVSLCRLDFLSLSSHHFHLQLSKVHLPACTRTQSSLTICIVLFPQLHPAASPYIPVPQIHSEIVTCHLQSLPFGHFLLICSFAF